MAVTDAKVRNGGPSVSRGVEGEPPRPSPQEEGQGLVDLVRGRAVTELNARKDQVSQTLDAVARTVRRAGEPLRDQPYESLVRYADGAASGLERVAAGLRQRDVADLPAEMRDLARQRPGAFVAAGFAVGVLAARFIKSSAVEESPQPEMGEPRRGVGQSRAGGARAAAPRGGTRVSGT